MEARRVNLEALMAKLHNATLPEEVFGVQKDDPAQGVTAAFRGMVRECHPNVHVAANRPLAEAVTERLLHFKTEAGKRLAAGVYGDLNRPTPGSANAGFQPVGFTVGRRTITLTEPLGVGLLCDLYWADFHGEPGLRYFVKIARNSADNGLLEREFAVLEELWHPGTDRSFAEFATGQRRYVPQPVLSFLIDDPAGRRRANLLAVPAARASTIAELRRDKFPDGVAAAHGHWIFRRLLLTLWLANRHGFVHGAVTPDHVLIFPEEHGLVLLDWTGAARIGRESVPLADAAQRDFLPPELLDRAEAQPAMDIYMAAATTVHLLGGDPRAGRIPSSVQPPLAAELLRCLAPQARYRPQDAFELHEAYGLLLGRRQYAPMIVP
jgi:hypothetical protein